MSIYQFGLIAHGECTAFMGVLVSLFGIFIVSSNRANGFFDCGGIGAASLGYVLWSTCVFVLILFHACCGNAPTWHEAWRTARATHAAYAFSAVLGCVIVVAGLVARIYARDACIINRDDDYHEFIIFTAIFVVTHLLGIHECRCSLEELRQERPKTWTPSPRQLRRYKHFDT